MKFLGRNREIALLRDWQNRTEHSYLTVIYGRRRIGKTRLVEEAFQDARMIKFEGLQGQPSSAQRQHFLNQLAEASGRHEYRLIKTSDWIELLRLLAEFTREQTRSQPLILFFDEFQWLAAERTRLVSSLKYVWDNLLSHQRVHLILCGSVSSFLVKKVLHSKALYGRIQLELPLQPLSVPEIQGVFRPQRSIREVIELYMVMGGVPQYLQMVDPTRSVRLNLERLCFSPNGYLLREFDRIFASHFGTSIHYRTVLSTLALKPYANRAQLQKACRLDSGGRLTQYLEDLELAGFVDCYNPVDKPLARRIKRYRIVDPYVSFYFRFIKPAQSKIQRLRGQPSLGQFVTEKKLAVWRGLAFEHVCQQHTDLIAEKLGFGAVSHQAGSWFSRGDNGSGSQIDLMFVRADRVITLCEIKFQDARIGKSVVAEIERKRTRFPNPKKMTVETVLISASGVTDELLKEGYFNRILELETLFA